MKSIQIGDKVAVLDDIISGIVIAIDELITIETNDGFHLEFSPSELVREIDPYLRQKAGDISLQTLQSKIEKPTSKALRIKPKERSAPAMEVDLHIHQLVQSDKGMAPHEILTLQLDTVKYKLEFAFSKKIQKVVFIHGVGEGVLRAEMEFLLRRYENLKYYDADYRKYGQGALEVYILQNKKS